MWSLFNIPEGGRTLKSLHHAVILLLIISLCTGCALFGKNKEYQTFDSTLLDKLAPGQTTAAEVTRLFGAPSQVVKMSNGNAYIYKRSVAKGTGIWLVIVSFGNYDKQYDQIVLFFDTNDIMTHYGVSLNAGKASYGFPF
ncbi:MAG: outer membrane protein assembly factor BamE [Deltaproteobacteria bacterium]|nr:MAG: outer membrane protein assembly factor BamE [Deltaproteobacteria bacterium]